MRILVTGGLGNLGSWLTRALVQADHQVTTLSGNNREVLLDLSFERLFADISNFEALKNTLADREFDVIIHLASVNEGNLPGYPKIALEVNSWGTRNLLQWVADKATGINLPPHFIYFSTFHVYGQGSGFISEDTTPEPKHDYGTTHLFAEYYLKQFSANKKIPYTIFRLTNSYGVPLEKGSSKWYLVLNDLCHHVAKHGVVALGSNGKPVRDFIWMGDVCHVVLACIEKGGTNQLFNLGGGKTYTMLQVAEVVALAYRQLDLGNAQIKINTEDKAQHDQSLAVSIEKLQNWIDFQPTYRLLDEAKAIILLAKQLED